MENPMNSKNKPKVCAIIGARPQFIKHAPIEIASQGKLDLLTIHTGQHYDYRMSQVFFDELGIKKPDYMLAAGGGTHGEMTGKMLIEIEKILMDQNPDMVLVYGDTNSTLAGALAAAKLNIQIAHIEAGLRSYNREMPEEINRVLTDHISTLLFTPTNAAVENLRKEGITSGVFLTGDVMCDMIRIAKEKKILKENKDPYIYMTLHRPYNTDNLERLHLILNHVNGLPHPVNFYIHPRTKTRLETESTNKNYSNITYHDPLSYFDNLNAMNNSQCIITDSGGIQKEAYILKKKCITLRSETEWIETLQDGWNTLVWENLEDLPTLLIQVPKRYEEHLYGNGSGAQTIISKLLNSLS